MGKKWYKTNWGVALLILLFYPAGLFFMWKDTNWSPRVKWGITAIFVVFFIITYGVFVSAGISNRLSQQKNITTQPTTTPVSAGTPSIVVPTTGLPTNTPEPTLKSTTVLKKITEKINSLSAEKYPSFEITIWNKNSDLASEGETPYEIVLNGSFNKTIASSCDDAKKISYYMLETFYKDNEIRPTLSRIMITIPYYLRVSLGANDGVPMAEKGNFSGPTNFWTVMENVGLGENESGDMKNRTWGNYLTECE